MSNRIRCKMICQEVTPNTHGDQTNPMALVRFGAVWSPESGKPEDENAVFGKYTPWGEYKASWALPVAELLEVGKAYYLDFTLAE
ncbi:hypothetical protein D3879_14725 [Pseudomonas cavernicola]|uniref:Uncharacterized protein n=1 Tax=Pseudomonas cavernicola TaxID=2320866 RepID=A0A418XEH0_9PSED|nr:hypothetical protein [Pseudomonas cavernicola]RJG10931.1 hypothetical protein D3879_14725 [Pseudomonas cavernicola]